MRLPIFYRMPERLTPGLQWHEHIPFAMFLVSVLKPDLLVELGTHAGDSYCAFCQAVKELQLPTRCFAIDTWKGDPQTGIYGEEVLADLSAHHDARYSAFSKLVRSTFDEALCAFADESITLLHIDGYHSYEAVKHDFESWLPKMSRRGVVLFHDTNVRGNDFGAWRLWSELAPRFPHFEFLHGHGLGVLGVGKTYPKPLQELFAARESEIQETREFFFALGRPLSIQSAGEAERAILVKAVEDKERHIRNIEAQHQYLARALADKDTHLRNLEAERQDLAQTLADKDSHLCDLEAQREHLVQAAAEQQAKHQAERENLQQTLEEKDRHLASLKTSLVHAQSELSLLQSSAAWRFIGKFRTWKSRWFPAGTLRGRAYRASVRMATGAPGGAAQTGARGPVPSPNAPPAPVASPATEAIPPTEQEILLQCDDPRPEQACAGLFLVRGWAIAEGGIANVEIRLDEEVVGTAGLGQARPDVATDYPHLEGSGQSGFFLKWDSTTAAPGSHVLSIRVESKRGKQRSIFIPIVVDQAAKREYQQWIDRHEPSPQKLRKMAREAAAFAHKPLISIVGPVYRTPLPLLRAAIESVRSQIYPQWELCLADDGSGDPELTALLQDYAAQDSRIKITALPSNQGISAATNAALSLAAGEFAALLDSDDLLPIDALYWVAKLLQDHPDADLIYSDEDKIDLAGNRCDPFFKPDWSPDLLLCNNYICHFLVVRRSLLQEVGGTRSEYDGSQDHDLLLRVTERTQRIHHIPRILYHWRAIETSGAFSPGVKPKALLAGQRAIADYLRRNQIAGRVEEGCTPGQWAVRYQIDEPPHVTVIMPTGGNLALLEPCLTSLFQQTDYPNWDLHLIDNSKGSAVRDYADALTRQHAGFRYTDYRLKPFNFSVMNNAAVRLASSPLVLLLNDDMTIVNAGWLTAMVEHGKRNQVGAVGAKLIYPSGSIQHAGVLMGVFDNTGHAFKYVPADSRHYFCFPQIIRNCSAVTAACMLTRRELFLNIGGFDERHLPVAFQDVDYCLRLGQAGYRIVYTPHAVLTHHESVTKEEKIPNPREVRYMQKTWAKVIAHDPYYSPNLTRKTEDYALRLE